MPQSAKKVVREAMLLVRLQADGSITARQVHVDDQGNYAFGDADLVLAQNERVQVRNVIRSMRTRLEG